jgi:hypothetical protein
VAAIEKSKMLSGPKSSKSPVLGQLLLPKEHHCIIGQHNYIQNNDPEHHTQIMFRRKQ